MLILDVEPVTDFVRTVNLEGDPGNDAAEQILRGESKDDRQDAGPGEERFQLSFSVINDAEDDQQCDQVNKEGDNLAEEFGDGGLSFLSEVRVPKVPIEQG